MSFPTLILIILLLYLFFRLFAAYIGPWLIRIFLKRVQRKFFEQNQNFKQEDEIKKGKVSIRRTKDSKDNEIPPDLGEYIDFEEVNNNQKPVDE